MGAALPEPKPHLPQLTPQMDQEGTEESAEQRGHKPARHRGEWETEEKQDVGRGRQRAAGVSTKAHSLPTSHPLSPSSSGEEPCAIRCNIKSPSSGSEDNTDKRTDKFTQPVREGL